jgi:ketosteroid isomerase-like protein
MTDTLDAVKAAIRAASDRFEANFSAGDAHALVADYYTAEPMMCAPDMPLIRGRGAIEALFSEIVKGVSSCRLTQREVKYGGGDLASELGAAQLAMRDGTQAEARYLIVWRKTEEGWRVETDFFAYGAL